ncbi:MAG: fumarylacetoacetate hydrolase family protein [Chloroflexota bacterium]
MKIVRFSAGKKTGYGILRGQSIQAIQGKPFRFIRMLDKFYRLSDVRLLAPVAPDKIVAAALNYHSHIAEMKEKEPTSPVFFLKPSTAVIGPDADIRYYSDLTRLDYEGELGVVMKKKAWQVPVSEALSYVLGYTCVNDVTARDLQAKGGPWTQAKGLDTFAPVGPYIETDLDPGDVVVETYLNGERKQQGNTKELIFSVSELISAISRVITLLPGDVIATGTPEGIGPMFPGDTIEIRIPAVGVLRNRVGGDRD